MKGIVGVIAGACCAIVIACAASDHRATMAPPPTTAQQHPDAGAPRPNSPQADQIDALFAQIDQQRAKIGLPEQQVISQNAHAMSVSGVAPVAPRTDVCRPGQSETCTQTCTLKSSICDNAKKICDIASELGSDAWAAQKCADGNATCDAAKKQCCDCTP